MAKNLDGKTMLHLQDPPTCRPNLRSSQWQSSWSCWSCWSCRRRGWCWPGRRRCRYQWSSPELSVISYQLLSVIRFQLSVISYQLSSVTSYHQSSVISYHQLPVIISYQLSVISYQCSSVISYQSSPLPASSCSTRLARWSPRTSYIWDVSTDIISGIIKR